MSPQEVGEKSLQSAMDDPDGYWGLHSPALRAELIRRRLPQEYDKQLHEVMAMPESLEKKVCLAALLLVAPITQLFIEYHNEQNHEKSWRVIDPELCDVLKIRLQALSQFLHEVPIYTQVFQLLIHAIDSSSIEKNTEISIALRSLAVEMSQRGIPILLITLDHYIGDVSDSPYHYKQLEPDIKVLKSSTEDAKFIQSLRQEVERVGRKISDQEMMIIVGKVLVMGGWMIASKTSGDNILENASVIIPELYKYASLVMEVSRKFGVEMTQDDVMRCMKRLHIGHEQAHGLHGDLEFEADRVAVPAALSLALQVSEEEYRKQVVFVIADMCGNIKSYKPFTNKFHPPKNYEQGYLTSAFLVFDALTKGKVIQRNHKYEWVIQPEHHEKIAQILLRKNPQISASERSRAMKKNRKIRMLYNVAK
jgi:hypothetical protein